MNDENGEGIDDGETENDDNNDKTPGDPHVYVLFWNVTRISFEISYEL